MQALSFTSLDGLDIPSHIPKDRIVNFDLYDPVGNGEVGYYDIWKRLQQPGVPDIVWTPHVGGHWIATRGALVSQVLKDYARFSSRVFFVPKVMGEMWDGLPSMLDPPEHGDYRQILNRYLGRDRMMKMEGSIRSLSIELIESFIKDGRCELCSQFAQIFPIRIFLALSELPFEDAPLLIAHAAKMMKPEGTTPAEMAASLESGKLGFYKYLEPVIAARRANPGNDYISGIIHSKVNGRELRPDEINRLITIVLLGGLDTVLNFIPYCFEYLARHPELVKQIRSQMDRLPFFTEELFRRFPLVNEARVVVQDTIVDGVTLKAGDMVLAPTTLHGIDERENPNPMEVDLSRKRPSHCTFGAGAHVCAGMHLARLEVVVVLQEWLTRIPEFRVADGFKMVTRSGIVGSAESLQLVWDVKS